MMADTIEKMAAMDKEELSAIGEKGRLYCKENFSFEKNMTILKQLFSENY